MCFARVLMEIPGCSRVCFQSNSGVRRGSVLFLCPNFILVSIAPPEFSMAVSVGVGTSEAREVVQR